MWSQDSSTFLTSVRVEEVDLDDVLLNVFLFIHILALVLLCSARNTCLTPWGQRSLACCGKEHLRLQVDLEGQ